MKTISKSKALLLSVIALAGMGSSVNAATISATTLDASDAVTTSFNVGDTIKFSGTLTTDDPGSPEIVQLSQFGIAFDSSVLSFQGMSWSIGDAAEAEETNASSISSMQNMFLTPEIISAGATNVFEATFTALTESASSALSWSAILIGSAGSVTVPSTDLNVSVAATPVPVPAAAWLLGSGVLAFAGMRRRQRNIEASAA